MWFSNNVWTARSGLMSCRFISSRKRSPFGTAITGCGNWRLQSLCQESWAAIAPRVYFSRLGEHLYRDKHGLPRDKRLWIGSVSSALPRHSLDRNSIFCVCWILVIHLLKTALGEYSSGGVTPCYAALEDGGTILDEGQMLRTSLSQSWKRYLAWHASQGGWCFTPSFSMHLWVQYISLCCRSS